MKNKILYIVTLMLASVPMDAFAAGGGGEFPWVSWGVSVFNFVVFLGIIIYFAGPKIQDHFSNRREEMLADLNESKRLREEAEKKFEEYSARLEKLDEERKALLEDYHEQGEAEKDRLVSEAKKQVEKMRADAELIIQQEMRRAVSAIEEQAVDLAITLAEKQLVEKVDDNAQSRIVASYVSDLNEMDSAPGA